MDTKRFFLYFIVITALALAGCGGGGGGTQTTMPPDPTPTPDPCPPGQVGTPPNCTDPAPTVADLFATARNAEDNATGAVMTAEQAVKDAMKYSGMISVDKVRGDSMMAQKNAQTVLDAKAAADGAVTTAETALMNAQGAEDDAAQYDNDTLDSAITAAIMVAEDAVKDATAQAKDNRLKTAVEAVTGTDEDDLMTAADHAKMVAMAVGEALGSTNNADGSGTRVSFISDISASGTLRPTDQAKYEQNDVPTSSRTWEMIVGSSNVKDMRIAATGGGTTAVRAASFAGMPISAITASAPAAAGDIDDGSQYGTANYKGIPGTVFCAGSDCKVEGTAGAAPATDAKLTGSWYFAPNLAKEFYMVSTRADDGTPTEYAPETQYVRYGYWISGTNDAATVNVYAIPGAAGADTTAGDATAVLFNVADVNTAEGSTTLLDTEATYSGDAIGISLYKEFNTDGTVADEFPQTGEFTADVNLTATFGANASVSGKITNFEGSAVDSSWEVTLQGRPGVAYTGSNYVESATLSENPVALGSGSNLGGIWTATAYGNSATAATDAAADRPDGIYGHFNTHFSNGHAAGAYATRKD